MTDNLTHLRAYVKRLAHEAGKTEIEIIAELQAEIAAVWGDCQTLNDLRRLKQEFIEAREYDGLGVA